MSDIYELLSNEYVKSIIFNYVTNSYEYKELLILKYLLVFFRICEFQRDDIFLFNYVDSLYSSIRWYISESYLEDIKTLNEHIDINKFWYELQSFWYDSFFCQCLSVHNIKIKFVSTTKVECCLIYKEEKNIYRLAISHKNIESNLFNIHACNLRYKYVPTLRFINRLPCISLEDAYCYIRDYPEKYKIKDGFLVLKT